MRFNHTPAKILLAYFTENTDLVRAVPTDGLAQEKYEKAFYGFHSKEPDSNRVGPDTVTFYTTTPIKQGRLMDGTTIQHPGIQIRVRSQVEDVGAQLAYAIEAACDAIRRHEVTLGNLLKTTVTVVGGIPARDADPPRSDVTRYRIEAATRTTGVIPLGVIPENDNYLHVLNITTTINQVGQATVTTGTIPVA